MLKNILLWLVIGVILVIVFNNFGPKKETVETLTYSQFVKDVEAKKIKTVTVSTDTITGTFAANNKKFSTNLPPIVDTALLQKMQQNNIEITGKPPQPRSLFTQILISLVPMLLFLGILIFIMRQQMGGGRGGGAFSFGRSKARLMGQDQIKVTFADVAGCDEAKEEVSEVVDFLSDPAKFQKVGGRIPKGVLLVGSPGTGKTLLAKAVAGEAKVPFFSIAGSDFVEMFVGVGASRVRDMFEQAKKQSPCIIFIDEIDAVGRHRGAGIGGGHDEREQTLNQLLVEMDGFEGYEGVIVIAATNRPDVLDPALLRPGRFDRQVVVPLPDIKGREQILSVHIKKVPTEDGVDIMAVARGTPGFSGADLANLINEAALFAARANKVKISSKELDQAKDKIMMGSERRSMVMNDSEKKLTAYHEAGHAIVGLNMPEHDPVYKVSIIPRGRALGVTMFLPEQDRYSYSRRRLESQLSSMFGGRIAEEMIFGKEAVTTGASNDIQKATQIARKMVTQWGLSDKLGPLCYDEGEEQIFLGQSMASQHKEFSEETAQLIDSEVRRIISESYARAEEILKANMKCFHAMAEALIKYETIDEDQIKEIMAGKAVTAPDGWDEEQSRKSPSKVSEKKSPVVETETPASSVADVDNGNGDSDREQPAEQKDKKSQKDD